MVLRKKGLHTKIIDRLKRYYQNSITIPIINNIPGRKITNHRLTLRQGDCPSSAWFGFGVDPLLSFLEKRLQGIVIHSLPVLGPSLCGQPRKLPPLESRYKLASYCDDLKPSITTMEEYGFSNRLVH